jgi:hypothetical protein
MAFQKSHEEPPSGFYPRELAKFRGYTSCFVVAVAVAVAVAVSVTCLLVLYSIK